MEAYNKNTGNVESKEPKREKFSRTSDRVLAGLVVLIIGVLVLSDRAGVDMPRWIMSGPMLLIGIGFFIGARTSFRNWVWLIPVGIGVALLVDRIFWEINIKPYIFPAVIILVGLFIIFKPRRRGGDSVIDWQNLKFDKATSNNEDEVIDSVNVFGHTKKNILSKNFKGGDVVNFFGGCELNMAQADISGPILLEMTQVFGGAKIIVPSNWRIQSELVSVFGGVDDKRVIQPTVDQTKILVLKGTCVFGGLEIKSY